jgi:biotin transport system substrate-specific component
MTAARLARPTLASVLWPSPAQSPALRAVVLAILGAVLLTVSAKVQIPFYPVPMTLQPLVVVLIGAVYGSRLGAATVLLYLAEGAAGLPVFAGTPEKGIGIAYMAGPTGGYLAGFVLAAFLVGRLAERGWDRAAATAFAAMLAGIVAIYLPGVAWLATLIGTDKALAFGLYPFIWGDLLKIALGTALLPAAWALAGRRVEVPGRGVR